MDFFYVLFGLLFIFRKFILIGLIIGVFIGWLFSWKMGVIGFILSSIAIIILHFKSIGASGALFYCSCGEEFTRVFAKNPKNNLKDLNLYQREGAISNCPSCGRDLDEVWESIEGNSLVKEDRQEDDYLTEEPQLEKMSAAIIEMAKPLIHKNPHHFHMIIEIAIWVWNLSLLPQGEQIIEKKRATEELKKRGFGQNRKCKDAVQLLLSRKKKYYPENKSILLSHEIREKGEDCTITVKSHTPFDEEILRKTLERE